MYAKYIQLNRDCANICLTAVGFMSREGDYAKQICKVCATICKAYAQVCERKTEMDHCLKCAHVESVQTNMKGCQVNYLTHWYHVCIKKFKYNKDLNQLVNLVIYLNG